MQAARIRGYENDLRAVLSSVVKDVVEAMENALNTLEDISNLVESIVLKHA